MRYEVYVLNELTGELNIYNEPTESEAWETQDAFEEVGIYFTWVEEI